MRMISFQNLRTFFFFSAVLLISISLFVSTIFPRGGVLASQKYTSGIQDSILYVEWHDFSLLSHFQNIRHVNREEWKERKEGIKAKEFRLHMSFEFRLYSVPCEHIDF